MAENKQGLVSRINDALAVSITKVVGTMWCAYAFTILVVIPLFYPSTNTVIMYLSSSLLQLILLPLIMVGQSVQGRSAEARARRDHKMIKEELQNIRDIVEENKQLHGILNAIQEKLGQ
jgi:uncharacterized membrane protein